MEALGARPLPMAVMPVQVMSCSPMWRLDSAAEAAAGSDSAAASPVIATILRRRMLVILSGVAGRGVGQWIDIDEEVAWIARSSTSRLLPPVRVGARISTARL